MAANPRGSAPVRDYRNFRSYYNEYDSDFDEWIVNLTQFLLILAHFIKKLPEIIKFLIKLILSQLLKFVKVRLVTLPRNCEEFTNVENRIHETLNIYVDRIQKIDNSFLLFQCLVKLTESHEQLNSPYPLKEMKLFHATGEDNVGSIAANNFDPSLAVRSKFGKGVNFSPFAYYADKYCNRKAGYRRALILSRVLVGGAHLGYPECPAPKEGFDTTTDDKGCVYVKYCNHEFYPEYVAYYYSKQNSLQDCRYPRSYDEYDFEIDQFSVNLTQFLLVLAIQSLLILALFIKQISEILQFLIMLIVSRLLKFVNVRLVTLPRDCGEFTNVESRIRETLNIYVEGIQRIENYSLRFQYFKKLTESHEQLNSPYPLKEMKLFHATGEDNVGSIAANNFDPSLAVSSKFGVNFSPFANYADEYCNPKDKDGNRRALILSRVLVGGAHLGNPECPAPQEGFDTTTDDKGCDYVKYCNHEFSPEYVAYYYSK